MKPVIGVIPARLASTRFPEKPLALIAGQSMISHVVRGALRSKKIQQVWVATDDNRIADEARKAGASVVMTDSDLPSGTDRVWAATEKLDCDVIVNIQGDEPLIEAGHIDALIEPFLLDPNLQMGTLAHKLTDIELQSANSVKVLLDQNSNAIYFSRFAIPYSRLAFTADVAGGPLKHMGMYAYRKKFLQKFCQTAPVEIEKAESLEQLRALYLGEKIKVIVVEGRSWGVDSPEDVATVEKILRERGW